MIFWLKSFNTEGHTKYTVSQINIYPLGINVVQIITSALLIHWSMTILTLVYSFDMGLVV